MFVYTSDALLLGGGGSRTALPRDAFCTPRIGIGTNTRRRNAARTLCAHSVVL
jgi:hypothetical protein